MIFGGTKDDTPDHFNPYAANRKRPEPRRKKITLAQIAPQLGKMMQRMDNPENPQP